MTAAEPLLTREEMREAIADPTPPYYLEPGDRRWVDAVTARPVLIPVGAFRAVAYTAGITQTDRTLKLTGRLTRVDVGRRSFYPLADILAAAPVPVDEGTARLLADVWGGAR